MPATWIWATWGSRPRPPTSAATPTSTWPPSSTKTEAIARCMDEHGYHILWLAEHHFQHEGYECIPEHPDGGRPPGAPDVAAAHRLRLQHRAHVASAAAGGGLRHRRHPHRRAHGLRRGPRLPQPRGGDLRRPDARRRGQPRALRGAGRHHHEGVPLGVLLAPGQALHAAAGRALSRLRARRRSRWCRARSASRSSAGSPS